MHEERLCHESLVTGEVKIKEGERDKKREGGCWEKDQGS